MHGAFSKGREMKDEGREETIIISAVRRRSRSAGSFPFAMGGSVCSRSLPPYIGGGEKVSKGTRTNFVQ